MMPSWSVVLILKRGERLGVVEAPDERSAITEAVKRFDVPPALQNKIVVTRLDTKRDGIGAQ